MRPTRLLSSVFLLSGLLAVGACDSSEPGAEVTVRVMSQNVYLGGDLFTVALETDPEQVPVRVAQLYATVEASQPEARMAAIAAEIVRVGPDLVGLQEISTYSVQVPADNLPGGAATPATGVTYDFLQLLLEALSDAGASYTVASRSDNADVEFPATADGETFFDVRYQDADVILAREGVSVGATSETVFNTLVSLPVGGVEQTFTRSYQTAAVTVDGLPFTFVNTHLEVGGEAETAQVLQAAQLGRELDAVDGPLVLVGDINSDGRAGGRSYTLLTDRFEDAVPTADAPTCCQAADLRNADSQLTTRIDVVLSRGFERSAAEVVLDAPADRVGGLWPSDHAGVWADLTGRAPAM